MNMKVTGAEWSISKLTLNLQFAHDKPCSTGDNHHFPPSITIRRPTDEGPIEGIVLDAKVDPKQPIIKKHTRAMKPGL
jgi:hypothetical protein